MSLIRPHTARPPVAFGGSWPLQRRVAAAALALALSAAVLAGVWAGRHATSAGSPPPYQVRQGSAGSGRLTVPPRPSVAPALEPGPRLQALDETRVKLRARLSHADSPVAQARLARALAGAHRRAAEAPAPLTATAAAPLVHALRSTGNAYAGLAAAATRGDRDGFSAARQAVDAAEVRLERVVGSVPRPRAAPPAPPPARAAAVPASGPSSLLLVLAVVSFIAALALVHLPRARSRQQFWPPSRGPMRPSERGRARGRPS